MKTVQIPTDWTPEQAASIHHFLQSLQECIWLTYCDDIQGYYREINNIDVIEEQSAQQISEYDDFDDDIPF